MVAFDLMIRLVTDNIKQLTINHETFTWYFFIQCTHCKSNQPNEIYFTSSDQHEMQKGHGVANFLMKCKECKRSMSISINEKSHFKIECETGNDEGKLASFDCRGCELIKWIPKEGLTFEAVESGYIFEDVDISDVWCGYDEIAQITCTLLEPAENRIELFN